jgi:hypothetical protein
MVTVFLLYILYIKGIFILFEFYFMLPEAAPTTPPAPPLEYCVL